MDVLSNVFIDKVVDGLNGFDLVPSGCWESQGASTNAGGMRAVKYGVTRDYVRGLEVVLPNGDVTSIAGKLAKNSSGCSLLHLLIGSEGTLGILTKITLKAMNAILQKAHELGGQVSGEHGIGIAKREYFHRWVGDINLQMMRQIKGLF